MNVVCQEDPANVFNRYENHIGPRWKLTNFRYLISMGPPGQGSLVGSKLGSAAFIAADKSPSKCLKATKAAELGVFTFWFG